MNTAGLVKCAGALVALAVCTACGGSAPAPSTASLNATYIGRVLYVNGRPVTAARPPSLSALTRYATILPDRRPRKKFEYIINNYGTYASIFDYPKSVAQIGTIENVGGQGCTNALYGYGKGIIWIVAGSNQIEEFKVPQTPIKTLSDDFPFSSSCAMDTSGDLAVGNLEGGQVIIFKNATGSGTVYNTPLEAEYFDGYDNNGNLFADGFNGTGFALVELPKGSSTFKTITTPNSVNFPGSVQWDGTYVTVFDQDANALYQYTVSGTTATLQGTVTVSGAGDCAQTWIVKGLVY
ncbi:MAG: hypothetical protein WAK16_13090, partial [Candidatus Cybelea sp.]